MKQTILSRRSRGEGVGVGEGGREVENDINIYHLIKGKNKKQKKHGEEVEQKKLMAVLVLGQQCTLGNYKHKRGGEKEKKKKNLGLHSAQLSQIKKRTSASEQKRKRGAI